MMKILLIIVISMLITTNMGEAKAKCSTVLEQEEPVFTCDSPKVIDGTKDCADTIACTSEDKSACCDDCTAVFAYGVDDTVRTADCRKKGCGYTDGDRNCKNPAGTEKKCKDATNINNCAIGTIVTKSEYSICKTNSCEDNEASCCVAKAKCSTADFTCADNKKKINGDKNCAGSTCVEVTDKGTCCVVDKVCSDITEINAGKCSGSEIVGCGFKVTQCEECNALSAGDDEDTKKATCAGYGCGFDSTDTSTTTCKACTAIEFENDEDKKTKCTGYGCGYKASDEKCKSCTALLAGTDEDKKTTCTGYGCGYETGASNCKAASASAALTTFVLGLFLVLFY